MDYLQPSAALEAFANVECKDAPASDETNARPTARMPSAANVTAQNSAIADSTTADEAEAMTADAYALVCVVT